MRKRLFKIFVYFQIFAWISIMAMFHLISLREWFFNLEFLLFSFNLIYLSVNDPALSMMPSVLKTLSISNNICVFDFYIFSSFRQFWTNLHGRKSTQGKTSLKGYLQQSGLF